MIHLGHCQEVTQIQMGSQLASNHTAGTSTLLLEDVLDFPEDGYQAYVSDPESTDEIVTYTSLDDDASSLALAAPLAFSHLEGTQVWVYPIVTHRRATVRIDDEDETLGSIYADIPHTLRDKFATGIRSLGEQEAVRLSEEDGEWTITNLAGQNPVMREVGWETEDGLMLAGGDTGDYAVFGTGIDIPVLYFRRIDVTDSVGLSNTGWNTWRFDNESSSGPRAPYSFFVDRPCMCQVIAQASIRNISSIAYAGRMRVHAFSVSVDGTANGNYDRNSDASATWIANDGHFRLLANQASFRLPEGGYYRLDWQFQQNTDASNRVSEIGDRKATVILSFSPSDIPRWTEDAYTVKAYQTQG